MTKLGPELRPSGDPKRRPPAPGPQRICSTERTTPPQTCKDHPTDQKREKPKETERGHSPSTDRSRSHVLLITYHTHRRIGRFDIVLLKNHISAQNDSKMTLNATRSRVPHICSSFN